MTILNPCIQVRNVPPSAPSSKLRDVFASTGDVKGIWVRFQETHGIVILAFYDIRHAMRAKRQISSQVLRGLEDIHLEAAFITAENLERVSGRTYTSCQTGPLIHAWCSHRMPHVVALTITQITGKSSFVDETDGTLFVSFEDRRFQPSSLQSVLSSFGELLCFEAAEPQDQVSSSDH